MTASAYANVLTSNANFRRLWIAQVISELGDWFYTVAIFSFLIESTGSAKALSFAFVLQVLPMTFAAPTAGVINDHMSRRKVMIFADWVRAGITGLMLLAFFLHSIPFLYALLFFETILWAMFEPARSAVIPNITSGEETAIANAFSSATWAVNFAVGAALGGIVTAYCGRPTVFVLNSLSFMLSALLIQRMRFEEPHTGGKEPMRFADLFNYQPILEGFRYMREDSRRMVTILVKSGLSLMGTNWVILPLMGERMFRVHAPGVAAADAGTLGMSILLGSRGAGAMIGSFGGSWLTGTSLKRLRYLILGGYLMGAIGYLLLSRATVLWAASLCLLFAHAGGSATWVGSTGMLQQLTEDRFRGRVFSAEFALSMLVLSVISFGSGVLIDAGVGVRTLAEATGFVLFVPFLLWMAAQRAWDAKT
jgi:MFS family permease